MHEFVFTSVIIQMNQMEATGPGIRCGKKGGVLRQGKLLLI